MLIMYLTHLQVGLFVKSLFTTESPVKVGVGLVNTIFSKTLATAMRLILKLSGEFSSAISAFQREVSIAERYQS
jgi:hypothetical protein